MTSITSASTERDMILEKDSGFSGTGSDKIMGPGSGADKLLTSGTIHIQRYHSHMHVCRKCRIN